MRIFWALVLGFMVAGAIYLAKSLYVAPQNIPPALATSNQPPAESPVPPLAQTPVPAPVEIAAPIEEAVVQVPVPVPVVEVPVVEDPVVQSPPAVIAPSEPAITPVPELRPIPTPAEEVDAPVEAAPAAEAAATSAVESVVETVVDPAPIDPALLETSPRPVPSEPIAVPGSPAAPASEPMRLETAPDGSLLLDGKYKIKGDGTQENPYELSWDLLVSVEETYDPRMGRTKLPERITYFSGKYVKLTGYVAFPMFVQQPRELLSMLNQWDGCCIGMPPTPYDAVEVKLADAVDAKARMATYGVIEGQMKVEPYLAGDWLVGLYMIEDATFTPTKNTGWGN